MNDSDSLEALQPIDLNQLEIFERTYHIEQAQLPLPPNASTTTSATIASKEPLPNQQAYIESMFNYAWACCRSPRSQDIPKGIRFMKEVMSLTDHYRRDCLYYIAIGYFRLEDYSQSREYIDILLTMEPHHRQAKTLKWLIEQRVTREGIIGMAIVGGIIMTAIGAVAVGLFRRRAS